MDFYYDGQMRRYLAQFIRLLSHFYVETGKDSEILLNHIQKHAGLVLAYSEKLIQAKRMDIKAVT